MRRIALLAAGLFALVAAVGAAAPASATVTPPQPDPIIILDR